MSGSNNFTKIDTPAQTLAKILTVDGENSGLDADNLRGGHPWFGDGSDGDLTVSSGTTVLTTSANYMNVTVEAGATLLLGSNTNNNAPNLLNLIVAGTLTNAGTIQASYRPRIGYDAASPVAGRKTTAGAGNGALPNYQMSPVSISRGGLGGAGGGDGTNNGGNAGGAGHVHAALLSVNVRGNDVATAGTTGAGANANALILQPAITATYWTAYRIPGGQGHGGGSGALKIAGTGNYGGAPGDNARGGGILDIRARNIVNSGVIHADGEVGNNGETGSALVTTGTIAGGGGGSGGGGGGVVAILYSTLTNTGTIRAVGSAGGTGGGGREHNGTPNVVRASSNGGNGGTGGAGIVAVTKL